MTVDISVDLYGRLRDRGSHREEAWSWVRSDRGVHRFLQDRRVQFVPEPRGLLHRGIAKLSRRLPLLNWNGEIFP